MFTVKNIFKSLFSNQAALDNRKMKWYVTLIVVVLSCFLPWIPALTNGYKSNGGAVFSSKNNFEISTALKHVISEEAYFKDITVKEKDGSYSLDMSSLNNETYYGDKTQSSDFNWNNELNGTSTKALYKDVYRDSDDASPYVKTPSNFNKDGRISYYFDSIGADVMVDKTTTTGSGSSQKTETTKVKERRIYLELYMFPGVSRNDENVLAYLSNFTTTRILNKDVNGVNHNIPHSYAFLLDDYFEVYGYPFTATTTTNAASLSYVGKLDEGLKKLAVKDGTTLRNFILEDGNLNIEDGFKKNFVNLADGASRNYTIYSTWINILIITCVTLGSILVSSILIIIFFKKKSSIYRESNFFHAINTATNMSLTPALLSMIFGFFMANYMMMIIIGTNLIRAVFIMNRICPPATTDTSKPVYQARS